MADPNNMNTRRIFNIDLEKAILNEHYVKDCNCITYQEI